MNSSEKMASAQDKEVLKSQLKKLFLEWHPDRVGDTPGTNFSVIHILSELKAGVNDGTLPNFETGWPETLPDEVQIDFPSGVTIHCPNTPAAFFTALQQYRNGTLTPENYPKVSLRRVQSSHGEEARKRKLEQDETLDKFWKFVAEADTLTTLAHAFDLFSLYSEEQLREIGIPSLIDKRASFLFSRSAWQSKSQAEIDALSTQVRDFPFFEEISRKHTLTSLNIRAGELTPTTSREEKIRPSLEDIEQRRENERTARVAFIARIRLADTIETLLNLDKEAQTFNFFNRGELGVIRSAITRRKRRLEGIDKK